MLYYVLTMSHLKHHEHRKELEKQTVYENLVNSFKLQIVLGLNTGHNHLYLHFHE